MKYRRMWVGLFSALILAVGAARTATARTTTEVEFTCPIGGERFKFRVERAGEAYCRRFDFKRIGPLSEPPPIPECPGNGFVVFKQKLSKKEIDKLTPWINSDEYQQDIRTHGPYYRLARIYDFLGRDADLVGWQLLLATWRVEETDPRAYVDYARAAVRAFDEYVEAWGQPSGPGRHGIGPSTARFIAAELSRRLGDFDGARRRFERLEKTGHAATDPIVAAIEVELQLVSKRDDAPHAASWNPNPAACEVLVREDRR